MKRWTIGLFVAALAVTALPAQALTVDDVIGLTRAGANDAIIISKIDVDGTVFKLTVDEILQLKEAGVSDAVITYMINSGKGTEAAVDTEAPAADDEAVYEDEDTGDADSAYGSGLDDRYRGSVNVSFGYYYPQWPGYWYTYYYDPFYWPSLSWYWVYWHPYPYYLYYYDPWYACGTRHWVGYWDYYAYNYGYHRYHDANRGYYVGRDGTYHRVTKERFVGTRGPGSSRAERVTKTPTRRTTDGRVTTTRRLTKPSDPRVRAGTSGRAVKPPRPGVRKDASKDRRQVRQQPSPSPRREVRQDPRRDHTVAPKPSRPEVRSRPSHTSKPSRSSGSGRSAPKKPSSRSHKP